MLEFNTPAASSIDPAANAVVGMSNFTSNSCGATSAKCMSEATGVGIDSSGNVFAADLGNNRVLKFSAPLAATGDSASAVLGQAVFDTSTYNLVDGNGSTCRGRSRSINIQPRTTSTLPMAPAMNSPQNRVLA